MAAVLAALAARSAGAAPDQFLTVGDPIEGELRLLDLFPRAELHDRLRLPHLGMRPLQLREIQGSGAPPPAARPEVARSLARIERVLGRDAHPAFAADPLHPATPRLLQRADDGKQVLEVSTGIEGRASSRKEDSGSAYASGSGLHARIAAGFDGWLAYSHLVAGRYAEGRRFADPLIANTDIVVMTEETYLAYTPASQRWAASVGRGRWHWGPGNEGSLVLSRTAAPITGLAMRASLEAYHLDGMVLNATLRPAAGEQLAAHRVEWQPCDALRLGISEAARYRATGWQWAYVPGILPYSLAQRLHVQDEPDSGTAVRNNILIGFDLAWRVAPGTRLYGELAVDDLHSKTSKNPDKIAWQIGWDGAGMIADQRLSWSGEVTRLWRYVYTSYFGRVHEAQGLPLGFPTGPDARRVRLHAAWDPSVDWQLSAGAVQTDLGESGLDRPCVPGTPRSAPSSFEGTVERSREVELALRWWPAGGVDMAVGGAWRRVRDADHVPGRTREDWRAQVELHLVR